MSCSPDPASVALAPRPWLTREPAECAFPVGGDGKWTLACCNPCGRGPYCRPHVAIMRGPKITCVSRFESNIMKILEKE